MQAARTDSGVRVWTPVFFLLIALSFSGTAIVDSLQAALPILVRNDGYSSTVGGLTVTAFALAAVFPSMVAGVLADAYGCRRIMVIGSVIFLAGAAGALWVPGIVALICFRVVQGTGFAMLSVTTAAGASNVLPPSRLGEGLGYFGVGQALSVALGPVLGLALVGFGSGAVWSAVFAISVAIFAGACVCRCNRTNADGSEFVRPKFSWRGLIERRAVLPALMILIFCTGVCALIVFGGLYAGEMEFGNASPFFICMAAGMLAVRFASKLFMDKYRAVAVLIPSQAVGLLAFLTLALMPGRTTFYLAGLLFGLSFGVTMPLLAAVAVRRTPKERWGAANATYYLCLNLGFGAGAVFGGACIDLFGFHRSFFVWTLSAVIPAVLGLIFMRRD